MIHHAVMENDLWSSWKSHGKFSGGKGENPGYLYDEYVSEEHMKWKYMRVRKINGCL